MLINLLLKAGVVLEPEARVQVPALNVTSSAFGRPNLEVPYITSSGEGMNEKMTFKYPEAGALFKVALE